MIIQVKVKPNSTISSLKKISETEFTAHITSPPEKGKANLELIKLLSKHFSVPQTKIKIKTPLSRTKIVEILA